jgi:hypothetical protein
VEAFKVPTNIAETFVFEAEDAFVPEGTFIADFVASLRGVETCTLFSVWTALWVLSAASCREVGLRWLEDEALFPNLYIIIVAPPGRIKKSTTIRHGVKVLAALHEAFPDEHTPASKDDRILRELTDFNWVTSKSTPEAIEEQLKPPPGKPLHGESGMFEFFRGSQLTLCISELTTFLNKRKYTMGLIDMLTALYDCDSEMTMQTIGRGVIKLEDVFVTMIGATTPSGMKEALPPEAFGEGFMSRVGVVFKESTPRRFSAPVQFEDFPTVADLGAKLAFLLRKGRSVDYRLTPEAQAWFDHWYAAWRNKIDADDAYNEAAGEFRYDVILRRIALLVAFARYDRTSHLVEVCDFEDALRIMEGTSKGSASQKRIVAAKEGFKTNYELISAYIDKRRGDGPVSRRKIIQYMSSKSVPTREVDAILTQLEDEGVIVCLTKESASKKGEITYRVLAVSDVASRPSAIASTSTSA